MERFDFGEQAGWEYYMEHFELPFCDRYLRQTTDSLPAVAVFLSGDDRWPSSEPSPQQFVDLWRCGTEAFVPCRVKVFHQRDAASSVSLRLLPEK